MENWRRFNDRIKVSNLGNVKKDGKVIEPCGGNPYDFITDRGKMYRVHILVGEMFQDICGEKVKWGHLHHKNRNQKDNRAENLVWLSRSEHRRIHQKEDGVSVPVKAYDLNGNFVGEWESMLEAAKATNQQDHRHISEIIKGKTRRFTAKKMYWFKSEITDEEIKQKIAQMQLTKNEGNRKKS